MRDVVGEGGVQVVAVTTTHKVSGAVRVSGGKWGRVACTHKDLMTSEISE